MVDSPSKKTRILFLTNSMGTGGVGNQLYNLSTRLQHRGYKVKIRVLSPLGRFGEMTKESGIDVESFDLDSKLLAPLVLFKIRRLISTFEPDILHTHLFHATILGRLSSIITNTSLISTVHTTYEENIDGIETAIRDEMYKATDPLCDLTTFVGQNAKERYVKTGVVSRNKALHIHNGIDVDQFSPKDATMIQQKPFTWTIVGNLLEHKGHHSLLEATKKLVKDGYDLRLTIIGSGPLDQELRTEVERLDIADIVSFKGRVDPARVPDYLNETDAFVLSSLREGFGLVVAEAMACELPVVATNTGGPSEIVEDGKTGFLAQRGSFDDLANNMRKVMELTPEQRKEFGERGRKRVKENYSIEQTVAKWIEIYETYS